MIQAVEQLEKLKTEEVNKLSITHAIGWSGLFNSFASDNSKKVDPKAFLPFLQEQSESSKNFSKATTAIIKRLAERDLIPRKIYLILRQIEELEI